MLFTSSVFILYFLPLLFLCYFAVPKRFIAVRNVVLLIFSIVFYAWGGIRYLGLFVASITTNYLGGLAVGLARRKGIKRFWLILTLCINLGLLGWFKYAGFVSSNLKAMGFSVESLNIILPIGISFFTFQALSYVIDVYRGDAKLQKNPINVFLYVALFPQLVAGPIVRYTDVEREISKRDHSLKQFSDGCVRFMLGFGKKMLLANAMGEVADAAFGCIGTSLMTTPLAWVGAVAYTFQIYFDFSAYSDMAIGMGRMFGFHFNENFNYPYIATSVTDFWRRWHISLSTWFRDYVYIPLGGNRCSVSRHILNLAIVWTLTGLWHGAAWNFILWGMYYGILLIAEKYLLKNIINKLPKAVTWFATLVIVVFGWILFRAETLSDVISYISAMLGAGGKNPNQAVYFMRQYAIEFIFCFIAMLPVKNILLKFFEKHKEKSICFVIGEFLPKGFALLVFVLGYMKLVSGGFNPFIYFQF